MKYYAVLDFECTCDGEWEFPNEIIEFPVLFLHPKTLETEFVFRRFVRPTENPVILPYCTELTGIQQSDVDEACELETVLEEFQDFLDENELDILLVTDGPWDVEKFLVRECRRKGLPLPRWCLKWLDIRRRFQNAMSLDKWLNIEGMLCTLGMEFDGRQHSGIDDARNISRILKELLTRGHKATRANRRVTVLADDSIA